MYGIGTDIVAISRIHHWADDRDLLDYIFTPNEQSVALKKKQRHRHLASAFAAKEACMKAMGTGWSGGVQWKDIELVDEDGKESIRLYNEAGELWAGKKIFVSTSGDREFAVAMVVISDDA